MFSELGITVSDGTVWLSIGQGLLVGAICLFFGVGIARFVGLLDAEAPAGETLGVGLTAGLLVLASSWAAVASGGRSAFTPVGIGFVIAIGLAAFRRLQVTGTEEPSTDAPESVAEPSASRSTLRRVAPAVLGGAIIVVAVALLYGSTLVQSPRDGLQPLEVMDEAYYSILGRDLAETGTETIYSPSGFDRIEGLPSQTWYHWGEAWLAAAVITVFGAGALDVRHFMILPLLVLAVSAVTGTLVRRLTGATSSGAFIFGFLACLFLAPVPLIAGPHFSSWAVGMIFGITLYGLAAVAVLFTMYSLAVLGSRQPSWALAAFAGSAGALILPAHVVIAVLGVVGLGSVWAIRIGRSLLATRRLPDVALVWRRTFLAGGIALVATLGWGVATGHGVVSSGLSPGVAPFNASWSQTVAIITLGAFAFLAIAIAWVAAHESSPMEADLYLGIGVLLVAGVLAWGARLGDYNTFHLFFAGIAVFATPAAAVAVWSIWQRLRAAGHGRLAIVVLVLCGTQIELGAALGVVKLQAFGPHEYAPLPEPILTAIRSLPADAKLAYACQPFEELAPWDARLLGLDAHTGRRIVPMCFEADFFGQLVGGQKSADNPNPLFQWAPQRSLYPDAAARPSPKTVAAFLKANGVHYLYADAMHPNSLVPDAIPLMSSGLVQLLQIP
jgi:hypothetical protein